MTRHEFDWDAAPLEARAEMALATALEELDLAANHPSYPTSLKIRYEQFRPTVALTCNAVMRDRIKADAMVTLHPGLAVYLDDNLDQTDAVVLTHADPPAVLVSQEYAGSPGGRLHLYDLLANMFGHTATMINETVPLSSFDPDFLVVCQLADHVREVRMISGLENFKPSHARVQGYTMILADDTYTYNRLYLSHVLDNVRAKILGLHLMAHIGMAGGGDSFAETVKIMSHHARQMGTAAALDSLVMDVTNRLGWEQTVPVCLWGRLADFLELTLDSFAPREVKGFLRYAADLTR